MERNELPRWLVPAVALAIVVSYIVSEAQAILARADCVDTPGTAPASCPEAPSVWVLVVTIVIAILIALMLVRQLRRPRR